MDIRAYLGFLRRLAISLDNLIANPGEGLWRRAVQRGAEKIRDLGFPDECAELQEAMGRHGVGYVASWRSITLYALEAMQGLHVELKYLLHPDDEDLEDCPREWRYQVEIAAYAICGIPFPTAEEFFSLPVAPLLECPDLLSRSIELHKAQGAPPPPSPLPVVRQKRMSLSERERRLWTWAIVNREAAITLQTQEDVANSAGLAGRNSLQGLLTWGVLERYRGNGYSKVLDEALSADLLRNKPEGA